MTSRRNPKLREFITEVREDLQRLPARIGTKLLIPPELALAAADYIEARLKAAAKGGLRATRPKPGRPVKDKSRAGELNRARVKKHRDKNPRKASGGLARAEALTPTRRSEIAKKAANTRWRKKD